MSLKKVFEFTHLDVDNRVFKYSHFRRLVNYNERFGNKFFSVGNDRVYFKNYVGVFQVGDLTIEILPKADKTTLKEEEAENKWHNALINMLQMCGYLNIDSISRANLNIQKISLMDLYYKAFIDEVRSIIHFGLTKKYRYDEDNLPYLKGRLAFSKHISENYLHKEKFYSVHQVYDHNNVHNKIIRRGLMALKDANMNSMFYNDVCELLVFFEGIDNVKITDKLFDELPYSRNTKKYRSAIDLARLILQNYSPDIHNGQNSVIGILFDMNKVFEKVVYRILQSNVSHDNKMGLFLCDQKRKELWNGKNIKPDIVGEYRRSGGETQRFIIDTKWKLPGDSLPSDSDLKQMFAYNVHFGAQQSVLLYPQITATKDLSRPFEESEAIAPQFKKHSCASYFIDLFTSEGKIDKKDGERILNSITV